MLYIILKNEDYYMLLSTDIAAIALGVSRKTVDNVLAREAAALVAPGRRGRRRRIPEPVLEQIAIALVLNRDFGVGVAKGLELATAILRSPTGSASVGSLGSLTFDIPRLREALRRSIGEALEGVAEPVRGRPRS
jgi:hypothetical protein